MGKRTERRERRIAKMAAMKERFMKALGDNPKIADEDTPIEEVKRAIADTIEATFKTLRKEYAPQEAQLVRQAMDEFMKELLAKD